MQPSSTGPASPSSADESRERETRSRALLLCCLLLVTLFSAWYLVTGEVWEDFLITLRHSQNAAQGNGLLYHVGERVHGFTSPINVLLPTLVLCLFPDWSPSQVLGIYNGVALACMVAGLLPLLRALMSSTRQAALLAGFLFCLLLGLNAKICSFSMNGQEAAFTIAFLAPALALFLRPAESPGWRVLALSFAGLMWTRPDGFLAWLTVVAVLFLLSPGRRTLVFAQAFRGGLVGVLGYAPWLVWAWWYYGSPIPHTILAKSQYKAAIVTTWAEVPGKYWDALVAAYSRSLAPSYAEVGEWPPFYMGALALLSAFACLCWLVPRLPSAIRAFSLAGFLWLLYMAYLKYIGKVFPWYFITSGVCIAGVYALLLREGFSQPKRWLRGCTAAVALLVLLLMGYGYGSHMGSIRDRQLFVEDGIRTRVGLWLREHMKPGDRVYLEPLGYIGYYSRARMLDYPGLVNPGVVAVIRQHHAGFVELIPLLKPEWLVLRPDEIALTRAFGHALDDYEPVQGFILSEEGLRRARLDRSFALRADNAFTIYRRRSQAAP